MTTIESSTRGNPDDPGHRSSSRSGQPSPDDGHHGGHAPDDAFAEAEHGAIGQTAPGADGERSTEPQQADGNRYGPRQFEQLPGDKPMAKAVLRLNYLFRGLPEATLERLASLATRRIYPKGTVIFSQGDPGDALFGVASGRVRVSASGTGGREVFLNIMEPGDTFGEIAVIDGLSRTAGASALDQTTLVVLKRSDFLSLLEREPRIAIHLLKLLCERLRWTSELVEESAFLSGTARLAKRLLILASLHGRPAGREQKAMELRISQTDLAQFLGASRQAVNKHLGEWSKAGWVDLGRARIIVREPDELRKLVADAVAEYEE